MDDLITFKRCTYCSIYLPPIDFYIFKGTKVAARCKKCFKLAHKLDSIKFRDKINARNKSRRRTDEQFRRNANLRSKRCRDKIKNDPIKVEKQRKYERDSYYKNRESKKLSRRKNYINHVEDRRQYGRDYYYKNKAEIKERRNEYIKQRVKSDIVFNFCRRIRGAVRRGFLRLHIQKSSNTFSLLGYTKLELVSYLNTFIERPCVVCNLVVISNMPKNYHIDHIQPVCSAQTCEDVVKLNQLNNLRLICKTCNSKKLSEDIKKKAARG